MIPLVFSFADLIKKRSHRLAIFVWYAITERERERERRERERERGKETEKVMDNYIPLLIRIPYDTCIALPNLHTELLKSIADHYRFKQKAF